MEIDKGEKLSTMSKLFLLVAVFLCCTIAVFSQEQETYFKGEYLKKYEGTWIGVHDKDTLILILEYKEHFDLGVANARLFVDAIIGWHCYKKNNVVESTTFDKDSLRMNKRSIMIATDKGGNQFASLYEQGRKQGSRRLSIRLSEDEPDIMIWETGNPHPTEGIRVVIKGDTIPKYTEDDYPESNLVKIKEWKLARVKN